MLKLTVIFAVSYFLFANINVYGKNRDAKSLCFLYLMVALCLIAGLRELCFPDTYIYVQAFMNISPDIFDLDYISYGVNKLRLGYGDVGFVFISKLIKMVSDDWTFYLCVVGSLTFLFLYRFISSYNLYPFIGLFVYISRFMIFRNMAQIRAALALSIVLFAIRYTYKRDLLKFLLIVFAASSIHISVLVVIPFYWLGIYRFSTGKIAAFIAGAFAFAVLCQSFLTSFLQNITAASEIGTSYAGGTSEHTIGRGIYNPMIYYQVVLLLLYSCLKPRLDSSVKYYNTIKNAYLYSTILLIALSPFLIVSGRLSTIFATLEICILPAFIKATNYKYREYTIIAIGLLSVAFFYQNIHKLYLIIEWT